MVSPIRVVNCVFHGSLADRPVDLVVMKDRLNCPNAKLYEHRPHMLYLKYAKGSLALPFGPISYHGRKTDNTRVGAPLVS